MRKHWRETAITFADRPWDIEPDEMRYVDVAATQEDGEGIAVVAEGNCGVETKKAGGRMIVGPLVVAVVIAVLSYL